MIALGRSWEVVLKRSIDLIRNPYVRFFSHRKHGREDDLQYVADENDTNAWEPAESLQREADWDSESPWTKDR